jgi:hypothetical protein
MVSVNLNPQENIMIDRYTKTLLTIIALSLAVLAGDKVYETVVPEAQAQSGTWRCSSIPSVTLGPTGVNARLEGATAAVVIEDDLCVRR